MRRGTFAGILVVAGFTLAARAELKDNPYQIIVDRNPFGLKGIPPPEPPKKEEAPPEPPPDIKLTGITTLLGTPKVFLQLEDKKAKGKFTFPPPIAEGETENGVTVVAIDTENMKVRIKNGDAETTLDFKSNGVKPGGGGTAVASAAVPGIVPAHPGAPPAIPGAVATTAGRGAIVAGGAANPTAVNPSYPNAALGAANPYGGLPQRPVRTDSNPLSIVAGGGGQTYNPTPTAQLPNQPAMTKEEAEARIEIYKQTLKAQQAAGQAIPHSPNILPPTSLGRALEGGTVPPANLPR
jgi:hypothetical protein